MYTMQQVQYAAVIRTMIRHEDELTNHRIMWLLIGQGFIANAYVFEGQERASADFMLPLVGILVTLSAFLMLYKSYQARGYLQFLGIQSKQGALQEDSCPLWDGQERGSKAGGKASGSVHGSGNPVICWNRGCSCRAFSS